MVQVTQSTREEMETATGRLSNETYQQILDLLKDQPTLPVKISDIEDAPSFGGSFRAAAKRASVNVSIFTDKSDVNTVWITLKNGKDEE